MLLYHPVSFTTLQQIRTKSLSALLPSPGLSLQLAVGHVHLYLLQEHMQNEIHFPPLHTNSCSWHPYFYVRHPHFLSSLYSVPLSQNPSLGLICNPNTIQSYFSHLNIVLPNISTHPSPPPHPAMSFQFSSHSITSISPLPLRTSPLPDWTNTTIFLFQTFLPDSIL